MDGAFGHDRRLRIERAVWRRGPSLQGQPRCPEHGRGERRGDGEAYPSTGRFAVADPIARKAAYGFGGALGVLNTSEPSPTVTGKAGATTGRFAIADKQSLLALNLTQRTRQPVSGRRRGRALKTVTGRRVQGAARCPTPRRST